MANPMYGQNKADNAIDYSKSSAVHVNADTTLTESQSGATVFVNAAAVSVTLPAAKAGLKYKIIFGVATTAGADVLAASGDCFFGIVRLTSTTADQMGVPQIITHATAIAAPGSYDTMDFVAGTATIGGSAGDQVELVAVDDIAWHVNTTLTTSNSNPGTVAVIIAS
jgi:hypothetical protein